MSRAAATALFGATLVAAAILFGLASLHVPGVALLLLASASAAWITLAARRVHVELAVDRPAVEEGDPVGATVVTRMPGWSPSGELSGTGLGAPVEVGGGRGRMRLEAATGRRGRRQIGPVRVTLRDPLGLAERFASGQAAEVLVLPRVEPVRGLGADGAEQLASIPVGGADGPELEFDSLRPHRGGAPAARIHWPTVARSGELVERRLVADPESDPLVILDPAAPASEEALDAAVRAAASLCFALARAGRCRVLLPGDRRPTRLGRDLRAWPAVHARLALVEPAPATIRPTLPARSMGVLWVTASSSEPPRGLLRGPASERWLVTPLGAGAGDPGFSVAGCTAFRLTRPGARAA